MASEEDHPLVNQGWIARVRSRAGHGRLGVVPLTAALLAGCASPAPPAPAPHRLAPTACEKRALMTGQAPDLTGVEAVAEGMWWGLLAPEACPDAGGRLDGGPVRR